MSNQTLQTLGTFPLIELASYELFSTVIAQRLVAAIKSKLFPSQSNAQSQSEVSRFSIGLPTGGTPIGIYQELSKILTTSQSQKLNCFGLDEYIGVASADSYYQFLCEHFYESNAIANEYRHRPE